MIITNVYKKYDCELVILDRCVVDGLVYTQWLHANRKVDSLINDIAINIYYSLYDKYDVIFYTDPNNVELVDDGERSADKQFRDDIINMFEHKIEELKNVVVLSGTAEERLDTVKKTFEKYNLDIKI